MRQFPLNFIKANLHFDHSPFAFSSSQKQRILFGSGCSNKLSQIVCNIPQMKRVLLVIGRSVQADKRAEYISHLLNNCNIQSFICTISEDCATVKEINKAKVIANRLGADSVIALGGGKIMDTARALSILLSNGGIAEDYLWGPRGGERKIVSKAPAPHIIIPTNYGTGAELSTNSIVLDSVEEEKLSFIESPIDSEAICIDSNFFTTLSKIQSIQSALTIAGKCIEAFLLNKEENEEINRLSVDGFKAVLECLHGVDTQVKSYKQIHEDLAFASLCSSSIYGGRGLGIAHSLYLCLPLLKGNEYQALSAAFQPFIFRQYTSIICSTDKGFSDMKIKLKQLNDMIKVITNQSISIEDWFESVLSKHKLSSANYFRPLFNEVDKIPKQLLQKNTNSGIEKVFSIDDIDTIVSSALK